VHGHQTIPLGVEHFGQTGTIGDLYGHFGINAEAIVQAAIGLSEGRRGMPPLMQHDG
jgi:pyruvate dehydrogenase E1 component